MNQCKKKGERMSVEYILTCIWGIALESIRMNERRKNKRDIEKEIFGNTDTWIVR